jgi:hypothetical protein
MSVESLSFTVRYWYDPENDCTRLQVMRVDDAEEVRLVNSNFLVRVTTDQRGQLERCLIRHVASGREAYVQGGAGLSVFVKECLLGDGQARQTDASSTSDASAGIK